MIDNKNQTLGFQLMFVLLSVEVNTVLKRKTAKRI